MEQKLTEVTDAESFTQKTFAGRIIPMHVLNGGRLYIQPSVRCTSAEDQLADLFSRLENFVSGKRIYKLNFFAGTASSDTYQELKRRVEEQVAERFPGPVLCSLIAQAPLTCRIVAEVYYFDESLWKQELFSGEHGSALAFAREGARVLIGQVQANYAGACRLSMTAAFRTMRKLLEGTGFKLQHVIRQWNYIEGILETDDGNQRYQEFNNMRSAFYGNHFELSGFPAATGIGIKHGGIIIEFMAVDSTEAKSLPIDNPHQVAAHGYSLGVLAGENHRHKSTPKFERGRYLDLFRQKQLFISGTASIRGEKTVGAGNPEEQTLICIENIQSLYSGETIQKVAGYSLQPAYGHARIYLKNRKDFPVVKKTFKSCYGNLPVVYLIADICREDLLVEIEGKVILTQS